jgi:hypothetical protein
MMITDRLENTAMNAADEDELEGVRQRLGDLGEVVLAGTASDEEVGEWMMLAVTYGSALAMKVPTVLLTAADIADHFSETPGRTVDAALVQTWRNRYGPNRTAEEIAKAPTCPQPVMSVGVRRPIDVWLPGQLPQWDAWYDSRPGQGAGGGRPPGRS